MTVQLTSSVYWLNECFEEADKHVHVAAYLIKFGDTNILVDTGSFYHRDSMQEKIEDLTQGAGPDALILTHTDYPHAANLAPFQEEWGDFEVVASTGFPEFHGLPPGKYRRSYPGVEIDIDGRMFDFLEPPLADRVRTLWIHDTDSNVLFTADGFGHYHEVGQCGLTSDELESGVGYSAIHDYHAENIPWYQYVDPEKLNSILRSIFDDLPISYVAPSHGTPIHEDDLDQHLEFLMESADNISASFSVPGQEKYG